MKPLTTFEREEIFYCSGVEIKFNLRTKRWFFPTFLTSYPVFSELSWNLWSYFVSVKLSWQPERSPQCLFIPVLMTTMDIYHSCLFGDKAPMYSVSVVANKTFIFVSLFKLPITAKLLVKEDPGLYHFINQGCLTVDGMDDQEEMRLVDVCRKYTLIFLTSNPWLYSQNEPTQWQHPASNIVLFNTFCVTCKPYKKWSLHLPSKSWNYSLLFWTSNIRRFLRNVSY